MDQEEFGRVAASFATFHAQFAPLFGRKEAQRRSEQYLRGLLVQQTDRRNAENVAETIEGATPRALQRLLTEAPWPTAPVIDHLQAYVGARLNTPEGVFVIDESGFPKQGTKSVGVARALARCRAAGVPEGVGYQSTADLALDMLRRARAAGHLQGHWVAGDDAYGMVPTLRDALDAEGWTYVLAVPQTTPVFTQPAPTVVPPWSGRGRKPTKPRLAPGAPSPRTVQDVATSLAPSAWQELTVAEGAQGPRTYQFAALRVWESRDGLPGRACWLLLRRNLDGSEPRYYLSNAPAETPLLTLAQVAAARWVIETEIQTAKGETGLDEYEVRSWPGWHHHITLGLLAGAFLLTLQQDWGGKDAPDHTPASQSGAARAPAAAHLDRGGPAPVAGHDPRAQRTRQTVTHQASPPQAA